MAAAPLARGCEPEQVDPVNGYRLYGANQLGQLHRLLALRELARVEAHLRALERNLTVNVSDIVVKQTQPVRIAAATGTAVGYGPENIGPIFERLLPNVRGHLHDVGVRPGITVAYYDWPSEDGTIVVHVGCDVGDQQVPDGDAISVVDLPVVQWLLPGRRKP
jgi:hypothetical protein